MERCYTLSLLQPECTELRHVVCVRILFCVTRGFPLLKLGNESGGHPTIVGLVHKVAEIANIVCARRVNSSDIAIVSVTIKNGNDILRVFVNVNILHKVVECINNINSLRYLIGCQNVNCLIHKVKEDNYLKRFLYIVNNPIVAICNILFECAAFASRTAIDEAGIHIGYRPVIIRCIRFCKPLAESLLNAKLFAPLTEDGRNGVILRGVIAVIVRVVGIVETINPFLRNEALVLQNGLIRLSRNTLIFNNPVVVLVYARNLEPTDVSGIHQSLGLNVIIGIKVNYRSVGKSYLGVYLEREF